MALTIDEPYATGLVRVSIERALAAARKQSPTLQAWADSPHQSHLVTAERLAELLREAGFAVVHWNDLTESAGQAMREFLAREQPPLGLHVFVPNFEMKAANLVHSVAEDRARLIQAVLTVEER